jgi:hypothetical protein
VNGGAGLRSVISYPRASFAAKMRAGFAAPISGRKRVHDSDRMTASIVAQRIVRHLERESAMSSGAAGVSLASGSGMGRH